MLAGLGAEVTGAEPAATLIAYCREKEEQHPQGIRYVQADLSRPLDLAALGGPFDLVVSGNVLQAAPDWTAVMASCVAEPGLDPATDPQEDDLTEAYRRFPNFVVISADF